MKIRDHKAMRNYRRIRELDRARDKRENLVGVFTGFYDKFGNEICSGDIVQIDKDNSGIVLFDKIEKVYAVMRGLWYGERNPFDPRCYGKIDYSFYGKGRKLTDVCLKNGE